jgi:hypothetical protein
VFDIFLLSCKKENCLRGFKLPEVCIAAWETVDDCPHEVFDIALISEV